MSLFNSAMRLKTGIVLNIVSLAFIVLSWSASPVNRSKMGLIVTGIFALLVLIYTYYYSFWQSGTWNFAYRSIKNHDHSEYAISIRALRFAYIIFAILVLVYLIYLVPGKNTPQIIPIVGLIYFAHILPGVYIGWKTK